MTVGHLKHRGIGAPLLGLAWERRCCGFGGVVLTDPRERNGTMTTVYASRFFAVTFVILLPALGLCGGCKEASRTIASKFLFCDELRAKVGASVKSILPDVAKPSEILTCMHPSGTLQACREASFGDSTIAMHRRMKMRPSTTRSAVPGAPNATGSACMQACECAKAMRSDARDCFGSARVRR